MTRDELNQKLFTAARRGDVGEVQSLLDRGADVHARDDWALRWAAARGHTEVVALLLDRGADVHAGDDNALCWAAQNAYTEVVSLLLDRGAYVHAEDDSVLRWAAARGRTEVVALLLAQPTYTVSRLRAAMARCQADGWDETTDPFRMITARIDVLTAEDLAERASSSELSDSPTQSDGGLGL